MTSSLEALSHEKNHLCENISGGKQLIDQLGPLTHLWLGLGKVDR